MVLVVVVGSWFVYNTRAAKREPTRPEGIKTVPVARDMIEALVTATGSLAAERVQVLNFNVSGKVAEVYVKEGDMVKAGQPLARLDTKDLELNLKQAEAALRVSEATLARARKPASPEEIAAAKAAIEAAKASLRDAGRGPSQRDIELANLSIDQAKNTLWGAQGSRDAIVGNPYSAPGSKDQAKAQVANAEIGVRIAEINREKLFEGVKESTIKATESQLAQAESTLARLLSLPSPEDVAVAEAQVNQARVSVESAKSRLDDAILKAPFAGQLVVWNLHAGDTILPTTQAGTLVDTSLYHVDVSIDETEISRVAVGQPVRIVLDAFPEREFEGRVAKVGILGSNVQGVVNYAVRIDLSPTDMPIKVLMTASINIVVERKENVLVIPNRALRRDKQGKYVEILANNVPTRVYVTTGAANEEFTEVVTGLEEGQEVIISRPRENVFGGPFGG